METMGKPPGNLKMFLMGVFADGHPQDGCPHLAQELCRWQAGPPGVRNCSSANAMLDAELSSYL